MASGSKSESEQLKNEQRLKRYLELETLEREQKRLEINVNIGTPEELLSNESNTRRLRTRAIPVSPPVVPPRSISPPLDRVDRLTYNEESDLEV